MLGAKPEEFPLSTDETALIVVDMQNAYASPGGYLDLAGFDVTGTKPVIAAVAETIEISRKLGLTIVFFQNGWDAEKQEAGTPDSPNWWKSNALKTMRARPELDGQLITRGTWDYELVEKIKPLPGEIVLPKPRYSGFSGTQLDGMLRARRIRNLLVVGVASNVCVESTIRDAYFLEYFPIMVKDATLQAGPVSLQEATVYNVETFFGWTTTVSELRSLTNR
ncbi:MAG: isochorismatase family protein [Afipia sp.]|nr:isochorismatase family protein [Afipia sp.]